MGKMNWRALACAAAMGLAAAAPASAGTVTFEDVTPNLFGNGDSFTSGGFSFKVGGDFGGVDSSAGFFYPAPLGSDGQFYTGLNDSAVTMTAGNGLWSRIHGFDFSFVSPFPLGPTMSPGALVAMGIDSAGAAFTQIWDFGDSDANGDFGFRSIDVSTLGALSGFVKSVTFLACLYDGNGFCVNPASNQAQFSIDNIHAELPEPASLALVIGALGLLGATRRKAAN